MISPLSSQIRPHRPESSAVRLQSRSDGHLSLKQAFRLLKAFNQYTIASHQCCQAGRMKVPLCSTGLCPLRGRCPASPHSNSQSLKAGQRASLTTYCPWATCCSFVYSFVCSFILSLSFLYFLSFYWAAHCGICDLIPRRGAKILTFEFGVGTFSKGLYTILLICISTSIMGNNYQKNNANIRKSVMSGNFIEFPIYWRKPHYSKSICLEMTSKTKLLLQVENGEKMHFRISEVIEDTSYGGVLLWQTTPRK